MLLIFRNPPKSWNLRLFMHSFRSLSQFFFYRCVLFIYKYNNIVCNSLICEILILIYFQKKCAVKSVYSSKLGGGKKMVDSWLVTVIDLNVLDVASKMFRIKLLHFKPCDSSNNLWVGCEFKIDYIQLGWSKKRHPIHHRAHIKWYIMYMNIEECDISSGKYILMQKWVIVAKPKIYATKFQ